MDGLDFDIQGEPNSFPTVMNRVVLEGCQIKWMEANGLRLAKSVLSSSAAESTIFTQHLLTIVDASCKIGGVAIAFLELALGC